jgi:molybdopterin-guanine dinucleotide biosynthesis protein A
MHCYRQVAAFILAGGASSRMGRHKALLEFGGVPLIVHTARLLTPLVAEVTVVGSLPEYAELGLRAIPDEADVHAPDHAGLDNPMRGPLAGIAAALAVTHSPWNLIVACDLPYLSAEWLDWLLSRAIASRAEAVIPQTARGFEPLAAVYQRKCGVSIAAALAGGVRKVTDAIGKLRVETVYPREWHSIDPGGSVLKNMNEPSDYEEALHWWATKRGRGKHHLTTAQPTLKNE